MAVYIIIGQAIVKYELLNKRIISCKLTFLSLLKNPSRRSYRQFPPADMVPVKYSPAYLRKCPGSPECLKLTHN